MHFSTENFKIAILDTNRSDLFFNLINSNRPRLEDFFSGTVSKTRTVEDTASYCMMIEDRVKNKSYFPYIISDLNDNYIGLVDVKNIEWNISKAELGYFIDSDFEGKGIITKAVGLVVEYLKETYQFKKLLCRVGSENLGSIQVALNNGFEFEGTVKDDYQTSKGILVDLNYYVRIFNV